MGQAVIVEDAVDGGTQRLKANAAMLGVVLYFTELSGLVERGIEGESVCLVQRYAEDIHLCHVQLHYAHFVEQPLGERDGVVRGIGDDIQTSPE